MTDDRHDVTLLDPGRQVKNYMDVDRAFVKVARKIAEEKGWKVTVTDHKPKKPARRYR